jgi:hypothetical protein
MDNRQFLIDAMKGVANWGDRVNSWSDRVLRAKGLRSGGKVKRKTKSKSKRGRK